MIFVETIGSLVDKLIINQLKIYHVKEQRDRTDIKSNIIMDYNNRLKILEIQKKDLTLELDQLIGSVISGKVEMKVYRQFKMYNEKEIKD